MHILTGLAFGGVITLLGVAVFLLGCYAWKEDLRPLSCFAFLGSLWAFALGIGIMIIEFSK